MANFSINIDLNNDNTYYKGDALIIEVTVNESIADWEIRAQLSDLDGNESKIATANVTGGSDDQISIDDEDDGTFTLTFPNGDTTDFGNDVWLEIERTDANGNIKTIFQSRFSLEDKKITWTDNE